MNNKNNALDFEILGQRVLYKVSEDRIDQDKAIIGLPEEFAKEVVNFANSEVSKIKEKMPSLGNEQVMLLLALRMVEDRLIAQRKYGLTLDKLQDSAKDALDTVKDMANRLEH